ncbi:MAG TPA: hypothetical protein VMW15_13875 [Terracidiphilus sp.]|nr:hypothetical protein [Terracidiphilus sp.]
MLTREEKADVLRLMAEYRNIPPYRMTEEADRLDPPPAPELKIPLGPGDRGQYGGWPDAIVQHWGGSGFITVSFPDVWCSPTGACFATAITSADKFRRTKIAEIKPGDPVEIVGVHASECGYVTRISGDQYRIQTLVGAITAARHEIRKLKA